MRQCDVYAALSGSGDLSHRSFRRVGTRSEDHRRPETLRCQHPLCQKYSKYENEEPQVVKTEIIETSGGDSKPDKFSRTEVVVEKTTVVDKNSELENKKRGLRKRYGKH